MSDDVHTTPTPLWVKILVIVCSLPVFSYPWLISRSVDTDTAKMLLRLYPVFVVLCAACAWKAWQSNRSLTYILLAVMLLSHAAMWFL